MNMLINQCVNLVDECELPYYICGGYALELFINKAIRTHSDLDIGIFEEDKYDFLKFIHNKGWLIYEPMNDGLKRLITNPEKQKIQQICVFCIKPDCSFVNMKHIKSDLYKMEILNKEQINFDLIEVIFNPMKNGKILYAQNDKITRDLDKAILYNNNNIPYMSPEFILFCKSVYITREGYQKDFDMTVPNLSDESKNWLINALELSYPDGHYWLDLLKL